MELRIEFAFPKICVLHRRGFLKTTPLLASLSFIKLLEGQRRVGRWRLEVVGIANQNKEEKGPKSIEYIKLAIPTPSSRGGKTGLTFPRFQVFWVAEQLK